MCTHGINFIIFRIFGSFGQNGQAYVISKKTWKNSNKSDKLGQYSLQFQNVDYVKTPEDISILLRNHVITWHWISNWVSTLQHQVAKSSAVFLPSTPTVVTAEPPVSPPYPSEVQTRADHARPSLLPFYSTPKYVVYDAHDAPRHLQPPTHVVCDAADVPHRLKQPTHLNRDAADVLRRLQRPNHVVHDPHDWKSRTLKSKVRNCIRENVYYIPEVQSEKLRTSCDNL